MAYTSNIPGTLTVKVLAVDGDDYTFSHTFQQIADYITKTDGQAVVVYPTGFRLAIAGVSEGNLEVYATPETTFTFSAADSNVATTDGGGV